ncbi:GDSL esterase/lipase At4g16230-like isoform X3 [Malus domestica]|uniref:GDSL esterase/lipase At4g16230-like isoform X3 n=1 Tax=Malus domestica TaxID=3750 RepID=UPI003975A84F
MRLPLMALLLVGCSFALASFILGFTLLALLLTSCFFPLASSDMLQLLVWCSTVFGDLLWGSVFTQFSSSFGTLFSLFSGVCRERLFLLFGKLLSGDGGLKLLQFVLTLYNLAARKIMVNSVGLIGCSPFVKDIFFVAEGKCYDPFNQLAQMYNKKLKSLIVELNKDLDGAKFVYVDTYKTTEDIIQKFVSYGFVDATSACCSFFGRHGGLFGCSPFSKVCPDRSKYVFWDSFHLTDAANLVTAKYMMEGNLTYMFPMNVRQLVQS